MAKASLLGCRAALQRHLAEIRSDINIFNDPAFRSANNALDGHLKKLAREGSLKPVVHKETINANDLELLTAYFKTHNNPVTLTEEVWFYITYHFCLRSAEMQAMLRVDDLLEKEEENGQSYFVLSTAYSSKNHQGGLVGREKVSDGRIQSPRQVRALKKLISLIDPRTSWLFQMAKKRYTLTSVVYRTATGKKTP